MSVTRIMRRFMSIAYHEAGHAIAYYVLGYGVSEIRICRQLNLIYGSATSVIEPRPWNKIIISFAGPCAERRFAPRCRWRRDGFHDFWKINDEISKLHGRGKVAERYRRDTEAQAEELVTKHWDAIERLAMALAQQAPVVMSGGQMYDVISGTSAAPRKLSDADGNAHVRDKITLEEKRWLVVQDEQQIWHGMERALEEYWEKIFWEYDPWEAWGMLDGEALADERYRRRTEEEE